MSRCRCKIVLDARREVGNQGIVQEAAMKSSPKRAASGPDRAQHHVYCTAAVKSNRVAVACCRIDKILSKILVYYFTISLLHNGAIFNVGPTGPSMVQASNHHRSRHIHSSGDDLDESSQSNQRQGSSWSHWWSYDGISGPDYWNINKHWRLCTLGRKQSPVNIRTDRLVYDHLLGPFQLTWRRNNQQEQRHQQAEHAGPSNQLDSQTPDRGSDGPPNANFANKAEQQKSVQLRLVNSGRGIEAWLESGEGVSLKEEQQNEHLYLGRGPLSYEYKLFKIELHSAASQTGGGSGGGGSSSSFLSSNSLDSPSPPANGGGDGIGRHHGSKEAHSGLASAHLAAHSITTSSGNGSGAASYANNLNKIGASIMAGRGDDDYDNDVDSVNRNVDAAASAYVKNQEGRDDGGGDEIVPEAVRAVQKTSEHLIDGRPFVGEIQLHFYNKQLAASAHEALRLANEQPLASLFSVISVFISLKRQAAGADGGTGATGNAKSSSATEASGRERYDQLGVETKKTQAEAETETSTTSGPSVPLAFILDNLHQVENQADSIELRVARSQIDSLVTDKRNYVTYQGSMNRPPCAEDVDWILLNRALQVDAAKFGRLFDKPNTNQDNIRPVRQLNGRLLRTTISLTGHAAAIERHQLRPGPAAGAATSTSIRPTLSGEQVQGAGACGQGAKHNCTASTSSTTFMEQAQKFGTNRLNSNHHYHQPQQAGRQCNMGPNYVYQFTYGKL